MIILNFDAFHTKVHAVMRARYRRLLPIFGISLLLIVILFIWFDWNMIKPYVERQVTEKTGREFSIQGDLNVDLSFNPMISAEGISLANAEWGTKQPMLDIGKASFRVSLWDLLLGDVVLPEVSILSVGGKLLHPGGDTEMRREGVIRGYGGCGLPRITLRQFCPAKLRQSLLGWLIHNWQNGSVYRTFPTSRISRSNSFLTTS